MRNLPRHLLICALAACTTDPELELEPALDEHDAAAIVIQYNDNPDFLIVYNQNLGQLGNGTDGSTPSTQQPGFYWKNVVRCVTDTACNGFGLIPDVFVLQEISREQCEAFDNYLEAQLSGGANTWDWFGVDNWRDTSNHWMSSCTLHRRARFSQRQTKTIVQVTGNGDTCTDQGTRTGNLAMEDRRRVEAGLSTLWVSIANRHEDHFGTAKDTCDNATFQADNTHVASWDPTTNFCLYQNTRRLGEEMIPTTLMISAGDYNYEPKHCAPSATPAGRPNDYARCHYKAITSGLGDCAGATFTWPNLGWTDVVGSLAPAQYTDNKADIDQIHTKWSAGAQLMPATARNYVAGRIGKGFYSTAADAYHPTANDKAGTMTDHDGLLVKIRY